MIAVRIVGTDLLPRYMEAARLREIVANASEVKWQGVRTVALEPDSGIVAQAGGWSESRGLFVDVYNSRKGCGK